MFVQCLVGARRASLFYTCQILTYLHFSAVLCCRIFAWTFTCRSSSFLCAFARSPFDLCVNAFPKSAEATRGSPLQHKTQGTSAKWFATWAGSNYRSCWDGSKLAAPLPVCACCEALIRDTISSVWDLKQAVRDAAQGRNNLGAAGLPRHGIRP